MSKRETYYRQCRYELEMECGTKWGVSWIPENLAKVGKYIYFGEKTDNPVELWEVVSVSDTRHPESYLVSHERDYLKQRRASDI